jgi:hypothetical protein
MKYYKKSIRNRQVSLPHTSPLRSSYCGASQGVSCAEHTPQASSFNQLLPFETPLHQPLLSSDKVQLQPRFSHDAPLLPPLTSETPPVTRKTYPYFCPMAEYNNVPTLTPAKTRCFFLLAALTAEEFSFSSASSKLKDASNAPCWLLGTLFVVVGWGLTTEFIAVDEERLLRMLLILRPGGGGTRKLDISFFSAAVQLLLPSLPQLYLKKLWCSWNNLIANLSTTETFS